MTCRTCCSTYGEAGQPALCRRLRPSQGVACSSMPCPPQHNPPCLASACHCRHRRRQGCGAGQARHRGHRGGCTCPSAPRTHVNVGSSGQVQRHGICICMLPAANHSGTREMYMVLAVCLLGLRCVPRQHADALMLMLPPHPFPRALGRMLAHTHAARFQGCRRNSWCRRRHGAAGGPPGGRREPPPGGSQAGASAGGTREEALWGLLLVLWRVRQVRG